MAEETNVSTTETTEQQTQTEQKSTENNTAEQKTEKPDYKAMYSQDRDFQGFVDGVVTKATQTAVTNAIQKQQRLNDERLSESERLKEMSADQRASYWEQKAKDAETARKRDKEVDSLKVQTSDMFAKENIPGVLMDIIDFNSATAEDITERVKMLADYEYYPKGELEKRVVAAVNEKLKQAAPETHNDGGGAKPKPIPKIF